MSQRLKSVVFLALSIALGGGLLWLTLRNVEPARIGSALREADYRWLAPLAVVTVLSHLLRAWRWKLLLDALPEAQGAPVPFRWAVTSTFIGYLVNYAVPRLGEVARAANAASLTALRFPGVMGTVVAERVLDVLTLGLALLSCLVLFRDRLGGAREVFAENLRAATAGWPAGWATLALAAGAVAALLAVLAVVGWRQSRRRSQRRDAERGGGRLEAVLRGFGEGLLSVLRSRSRAVVLALSAVIWGCYLLMAYLPFRLLGLSEAYGLGMADAWLTMNVGAVGMAIPSPGGTGSYHYATVQALSLLSDVPATPAATYAVLTHAAQLVLLVSAGSLSLLAQGTTLGALRRQTARPATAEPAAEPAPLPDPVRT